MIANGPSVREYIEHSIRRIQNGEVTSKDGSWLQGVFGKAAKMYEQWARNALRALLPACKRDYEKTLRPYVSNKPDFEKLTLGQIAWCFTEISKDIEPAIQGGILSPTTDYAASCKRMFEVNDVWKECIKHGYAKLDIQMALKSLHSMKSTIGDLSGH
jgi:hypothetical protein